MESRHQFYIGWGEVLEAVKTEIKNPTKSSARTIWKWQSYWRSRFTAQEILETACQELGYTIPEAHLVVSSR
jgi:hypothetical protein